MTFQHARRNNSRHPARQHPSTPEDSRMPPQGNKPPFFDFADDNTEVTNAAGYFGAGHLHRLGLGSPYHPTTPTASATSPSASDQADFSTYIHPTTRVRSREPPAINTQSFHSAFPVVTTSAYPSPFQQPVTSPIIGVDWQRSHVYSNNASPALSSLSSASYAAQQPNQDPYMGDFVSAPDNMSTSTPQQQAGFDYYTWPDSNVSMALSPSSAGSLASPIMQTGGGFPENIADTIVYGGELDNYSQQSVQQPTDAMSSRSPSFAAPNPLPSSKPKLRSASRTSKNLQIRPDETPRERKSRNSHNLVEKQYRNRLNLQFESLMNALPESVKTSVAVGGGGPGSEGTLSEGLDLGERKLSKAQVLDISTRYIKSLEKDREKLERENGELVRGMERLKRLLEKEQEEKRGDGRGVRGVYEDDGNFGLGSGGRGARGERGGDGGGYSGT